MNCVYYLFTRFVPLYNYAVAGIDDIAINFDTVRFSFQRRDHMDRSDTLIPYISTAFVSVKYDLYTCNNPVSYHFFNWITSCCFCEI